MYQINEQTNNKHSKTNANLQVEQTKTKVKLNTKIKINNKNKCKKTQKQNKRPNYPHKFLAQSSLQSFVKQTKNTKVTSKNQKQNQMQETQKQNNANLSLFYYFCVGIDSQVSGGWNTTKREATNKHNYV